MNTQRTLNPVAENPVTSSRPIYTYEQAKAASTEYFNGDELAASIFVDKYALRNEKNELVELTPTDMHWRIANEFARIEQRKFKSPMSAQTIFNLLDRFAKVVMQGSPSYGIGNYYQYISIGNCFVIPSPLDSYLGIMHTDTQITQISCRRGGVGWSNSKLRPAGMLVKNAAKTTSGMIGFAKRFSNTVREVGQHGRRGASLQELSCWHPEIMEFIKVKQNLTEITGSNISVDFYDDFMQKVFDRADIKLRWPVCQVDADEMKRPFPECEVAANAGQIWDEFIKSAHLMAEPGCKFMDTVHRMSPGVPYGHIETASNPCGEQNMPPYASCRLLLLNLISYVRNKFKPDAYFDFEAFAEDVKILQRLGDDLVDIEIECIDRILDKLSRDPEPDYIKKPAVDLWENVRRVALLDRRTGCGFTALGDTIAALNMKYGSKLSIEFAEKMQRIYALSAYRSSVEMAKELGHFPEFDAKLDVQSGFIQLIQKEDPELFRDMQKWGRRNMVLLTVAPVGSLSCETQTTSGMEPVFLLSYTRRKKGNPGDLGFRTDSIDANGDHWMHFDVYHKGLQDWMDITGNKNIKDSPYYGASANDIDWLSRVTMQATLQKWIDNSISSTVNLPQDVPVETVDKIYKTAWKMGCKGITIYRDKCRDGVLVSKEPEKKLSGKEQTLADRLWHEYLETKPVKRPKELACDIHHTKSKGEDFFVLVGLMDNHPYEVFAGKNGTVTSAKTGTITKNKRGHYELKASDDSVIENVCDLLTDEQAVITRMVSLSLRHGSNVSFIVDQLEKAPGDMTNFGKALARTLKKYIKNGSKVTGANCINCGSSDIVRQEGCQTCSGCGSSKCS